ncbi:class D sortase [Bacillus sp. MRMR6]|uniref:class D sortase n=1 Tax=Bacillus sp. MRMR6 TaxID=1928617 RepID=UPI000952BCFA|nr:class D sortase [Bacillus sp. MRMR6]OLS41492.1 class D sortase [Bacillus sp. MRMR6]
MKKLPLLFISLGLIIFAIGAWQIIDTKLQSNASLKEAKELVGKVQSDPKPASAEKDKPKFGDTVGLLTIPKIKAELAIVEGTDPNDLAKGVGHYTGSYFPGENGQIVLSGHRDTVFRRLGELKIGDKFEIQMPDGVYTYEISHTKIVEADDRTIITLQDEEEELIVTTCYPFSYVGDAPQRYIIYAKPM